MNNPTPIEYQGQRILTTQQIARAYGTDPIKIQQNYSNNKERYVEGKHFHCLEGDELRQFKRSIENFEVAQNVNKLYLWTEKGAWLHAKSLGTDEAWEAYEVLVDDYYTVKTQLQAPISIEDMIILQAQSVKELKSRVDHIEENAEFAKETAVTAHQRIDAMDNTDVIGDLQQRLVRKVNKYAERNGLSYATGWKDFRQCFNTAFHTNINLKRKRYMESMGIRRMTVPEYLAATEQLSDALRVAEKMHQPGHMLN